MIKWSARKLIHSNYVDRNSKRNRRLVELCNVVGPTFGAASPPVRGSQGIVKYAKCWNAITRPPVNYVLALIKTECPMCPPGARTRESEAARSKVKVVHFVPLTFDAN